MKKKVNIVLDFGHGGLDNNLNYSTAPNKMFKFNEQEIAYEGELNRFIGGIVYSLLRNHYEYNVVPTVKPDDSRDLSLPYRVGVANQFPKSNTIFISIHCNAFNSNVRGFEIFTTKGNTKSDKLAQDIFDSVEPFFEDNNLNLRTDYSDDDADKEIDFYVLRKTICPAVLLECLFFDNYQDYTLLRDSKFVLELAHSIYKGIIKYIEDELD